jgi:hypothetical protein
MDYRYTDEDTLAVAVTITLAELDTVIRILNPIANEDGHEQRYRASDLNRKFEDIRTTMLKSAAETINYRVSALNK